MSELQSYSEILAQIRGRANFKAVQHPKALIETPMEQLQRLRRIFVNVFVDRPGEPGAKLTEPVLAIANMAGYKSESGIYHFIKTGPEDEIEMDAVSELKDVWKLLKHDYESSQKEEKIEVPDHS